MALSLGLKNGPCILEISSKSRSVISHLNCGRRLYSSTVQAPHRHPPVACRLQVTLPFVVCHLPSLAHLRVVYEYARNFRICECGPHITGQRDSPLTPAPCSQLPGAGNCPTRRQNCSSRAPGYPTPFAEGNMVLISPRCLHPTCVVMATPMDVNSVFAVVLCAIASMQLAKWAVDWTRVPHRSGCRRIICCGYSRHRKNASRSSPRRAPHVRVPLQYGARNAANEYCPS